MADRGDERRDKDENEDEGEGLGNDDNQDVESGGEEMNEPERHGIEEEIEEILRQQGEEPGRARRPGPRQPWLPQMPRAVAPVLQYALVMAIGVVLLVLSFRVLGPAGLRLAVMAVFVFLLFYTLRGVVQDIIRRRSR